MKLIYWNRCQSITAKRLNETVTSSPIEELARRIEAMESQSQLSAGALWRLKLEVCKEFSLDRVPKNSDILEFVSPENRKVLEGKLRRKSIRTRSGIAVVTAITKPFDCPHGTCTFCPGGLRFGTPQSYTQNSPAASFGIQRRYDPYVQVKDTLEYLSKNGHDTSKVELILLGGTILAMPPEYQREFVQRSYDALNEVDSNSMEDAIERNETARHRCVGLTIETKPDWCLSKDVDLLLSYGATRVEIGVQSLQDDVLKSVNRGHSVEDTFRAFAISRDSAFKIVAHMMPGLPGSNPDKDLEDLVSLFSDEKLRPDMLKIYPTLVIEGTALYKQYLLGKYTPYSLEQIVDLLCDFKKQVPPWVRIMRIQREIPRHEIMGGTKSGNLRQIVLDEMTRRKIKCRCIRCRESGHRTRFFEGRGIPDLGELELRRIDYGASSGHEVFLSLEDESTDTLFGFLRLRVPSGKEHRLELREHSTSLVRELHVYGVVVPVGQQNSGQNAQHRGIGSRLLLESERISKDEFDMKKQVVISASGTREYYRVRGYRDDGAYVSKIL